MRIISKIFGVIAGMFAMPALAQDGLEIIGIPIDRGLGFQPAVTELARDLQWLDAMILYIITAIVVFVTALMGYVIIRYNRRANPNPASFTHNSPVEIAWTVIPVLILTVIGVYSLPVLFKQQEIPEADLTIKVTGNQWYWGYEYVDHGFGFDSFMIGDGKVLNDEVEAELVAAGYTRDEFLLATDTAVVVPVGQIVVMQLDRKSVV